MTSVRTVSRTAGVSVATVSRVLNNHANVDPRTRRRVLAAMERSGYVQTVGRRAASVIGLAYAGDLVRADYGAFESAILAGILRGAGEARFDVSIVSVLRDRRDDESYSQFFSRKGLRGAVLRCTQRTRHIAVEIAREGFPVVVIADRFDDPGVSSVSCDSGPDSERAVEHLIALGHRRIALGIHAVPDTDHLDRRAGYERALRRHRLRLDGALTVKIQADMEGGASLITRLLSLTEPPTALFLTDPLSSLGALRRCHEIGLRVPAEFSIIGVDDSDIRTHTYPRLTAIVQDAESLALEAARWLTRRLSDENTPPLRVTRPTRFEINGTTSAPVNRPVRMRPDGTRVTGGRPPVRRNGRGSGGGSDDPKK